MLKRYRVSFFYIFSNKFLYLIAILFCVSYSCKKKSVPKSVEILLESDWKFRISSDTSWYKAIVPGDLVSDLYNNHLINDPYFRSNADSINWIAQENWEYQTTFDVPQDVMKNDEVLLHFAGLDTYADVYLNDSLILESDNMFRSWDVKCKKTLKERGNNLRIVFFLKELSTIISFDKQPINIINLTPQLDTSRSAIRKARYHFGTESNPRIINAGIWRPISIQAWNTAKILDVYIQPKNISNEVADYTVLVDVLAMEAGNYSLKIIIDEEQIGKALPILITKGKNQNTFDFQIAKPTLWWCNGMGSHYLYKLKIELWKDNVLVNSRINKFGIRKLELVQDLDSIGCSFYFKLNGIPLFMKGANYYPLDMLSGRFKKERYQKLIEDVVSSNMNMLRIQASGIYENDEFYDLCNEHGILVWQDFMLEDISLPNDTSEIENIKKEAIENVCRLRNNPCMALWSGNYSAKYLENKEVSKKQVDNYSLTDKSYIYNSILSEIVKKYSPHLPYLPDNSAMANNKKSGNIHDWNVWYNSAPFASYSTNVGRFVSEYGMQSFPAISTMNAFSISEDENVQSPQMKFRQRSDLPMISPNINGNDMIMDYIQMYYNDPPNFESFVYLSQIMQAEALKNAIEHHRINRGICMGSLYRQINDCWPAISWSTIDYYGNWKPAQYAVKKAFSNIHVIPVSENGKINIYGVNDSLRDINAILKIQTMDFNGKIVNKISINVVLPGNSTTLIWNIRQFKICPDASKQKLLLRAQLENSSRVISENILYFTSPKFLDLPVPDVTYEINGSENKYTMILKTDKLAKNLFLDTKAKIAMFSENNIDLIPGNEKTITVTYPGSKEDFKNDLKITTLDESY